MFKNMGRIRIEQTYPQRSGVHLLFTSEVGCCCVKQKHIQDTSHYTRLLSLKASTSATPRKEKKAQADHK